MKSRQSGIPLLFSSDLSASTISDETLYNDSPNNRSTNNHRLPPSSLRTLFDNSATHQDPFRMASFGQARNNTSLSASRDKTSIPAQDNLSNNIHTARQIDFAFPRISTPRKNTMSRSKSDDEQGNQRLRVPLSNSGAALGIGEATMSSSTSSISSLVESSLPTIRPGYRDVRTSRGVSDISIPKVDPMNDDLNITAISLLTESTSPILSSTAGALISDYNSSAAPSRPVFNRKRSQSSAAVSVSSNRATRNTGFPNDFHFPPTPSPVSHTITTHPIVLEQKSKQIPGDTTPQKDASSSSNESWRSSISHQGTHSLDDGSSLRSTHRNRGINGSIETGLGLPPSLSRAPLGEKQNVNKLGSYNGTLLEGSAYLMQPPTRRPTLSRQTSLPVFDSVQSLPIVPISTAVNLNAAVEIEPHPNSSNSAFVSLDGDDLLPPSPIVAASHNNLETRAAASLVTSFVEDGSQRSPLSDTLPQVKFSQLQASASPLLDSRFAADTTNNSSHTPHNASTSSTSTPSTLSNQGPIVRPLDFGPLMTSHDATHQELARTVDELTRWLNVVEIGLSEMLGRVPVNTMTHEHSQLVIAQMPTYDHDQTDVESQISRNRHSWNEEHNLYEFSGSEADDGDADFDGEEYFSYDNGILDEHYVEFVNRLTPSPDDSYISSFRSPTEQMTADVT